MIKIKQIEDYGLDTFTAAVSLVDGDLCYLDASGDMAKADASANTTADTLLAMCTETIGAASDGLFMVFGKYTTTGLTAGAVYYVSETTGAITSTQPTATDAVIRVVGFAVSTTVLYMQPSSDYLTHT